MTKFIIICSHGGEIEPRILIENLLGKGSTCKLSDSLIYDILANKHNKWLKTMI